MSNRLPRPSTGLPLQAEVKQRRALAWRLFSMPSKDVGDLGTGFSAFLRLTFDFSSLRLFLSPSQRHSSTRYGRKHAPARRWLRRACRARIFHPSLLDSATVSSSVALSLRLHATPTPSRHSQGHFPCAAPIRTASARRSPPGREKRRKMEEMELKEPRKTL
jgi:hypothetical protein